MVDAIEPRRNVFSRPAVANIDQLVIVASNAIPQTDPYLIDRMTAIAALKGCEVLICINKSDLDHADELCAIYEKAGLPFLLTSAETGEGIAELREHISGKLSAFTGNSGVGKSSLLNALDPRFSVQVGEVSQALGRGRHTTRHVELYTLSGGAEIIDTPGFSSFDTDELGLALKERLPETFLDFAPYLDGCRFVGCSHTKEKAAPFWRLCGRGSSPPRGTRAICGSTTSSRTCGSGAANEEAKAAGNPAAFSMPAGHGTTPRGIYCSIRRDGKEVRPCGAGTGAVWASARWRWDWRSSSLPFFRWAF